MEIETASLEEQLVDNKTRLAFLQGFPITQEYEAIYNFIHEEEEEVGEEEDIERRLNYLRIYPMIRHYEE
ncbi:39594_t:CDS:1, partial [Gigaspora margarita]